MEQLYQINSKSDPNMCEEEKYILKIKDIISILFKKYSNNKNIIDKLTTYLDTQLCSVLENICIKEYKKQQILLENVNLREEKKLQLIQDQAIFTNKFLQKNLYYYIYNTDIFIYYDGSQFKIIKEDDILHDILTSISQEKKLLAWKHKIKISIIKKIKEQKIFKVIPESITIQRCLNKLLIKSENSKIYIKYFLTVLGDIILKKKDNILYLLNSSNKPFIKYLSDQCYYYFGININNVFKYKYHEYHDHTNYRLLNLNNMDLCINNISKDILDIFCIAIHYSNRFTSADDYLLQMEHEEKENIINYVFYLHNNSIDKIVDKFINNSLTMCENTNISSKNILYIWKQYLDNNNLPTLIFQNTLKQLLKEKLLFDENKDIFINVFSSSLPLVSNFTNFWDETIFEEEEEIGYDLNEICILFKIWNKSQITIKQSLVLNIIKYYYPDIIIENNKYILNIKCSLWNKKEEVNKFLEECKIFLSRQNEIYPLAIDYLYDMYSSSCKRNISIIEKKEFEKYVSEILIEYIDTDKLISSSWWN